MKVLVACERSGLVRDAFIARGHEAISVDLEPTDRPGPHHRGDIIRFLYYYGHQFDMMIAFPVCKYLANSGVSWLGRKKGRYMKMVKGALFFKALLDCEIERICIENPVMHGHAKVIIGRGQDQTIQPYQFGEDASKRTCLWLKNLPKLKGTKFIEPSWPGEDGKLVYANQTPSGQNKLGPGPERERLRSETYPGVSDAMGDQWGGLL